MTTLPAIPTAASGRRTALSSRLTTDHALTGVLAAGFFLCGALLSMQDDSWWHLRSGRLIWQTHSVPRHDPFSFALPAGTDWPNHEWLAQAIMYAAYGFGGLPLMNLGGGVVVMAAGLLLLKTMQGSIERRFLTLALILPWIVAMLSARPQVFTLLGLAACLFLLGRERHVWLPVVFLFWANLHGGVTLGGLLMIGVCISAAMFDRSRLPKLLAVTALCGVVTLLTPLGAEILAFPIGSVHRLKELGIAEWQAPGFMDWTHWYFWLLLAGGLAACILRWKQARTWLGRMFVAPAALFTIMAVMSARNIPPFLLVAAAAVSAYLPDPKVTPPGPTAGRSNLRLLVGTWSLVLAVVTVAYAWPIDRLGWRPLPPEALRRIRACPQPTFNTYNVGGYLLWFAPERKVFIDSRQDPYPLDLLSDAVRAQQYGDHQSLFARYGFRSAVMERSGPLGPALQKEGWRTAYADRYWLVLVRDPY
jgi:hypothetical protein